MKNLKLLPSFKNFITLVTLEEVTNVEKVQIRRKSKIFKTKVF